MSYLLKQYVAIGRTVYLVFKQGTYRTGEYEIIRMGRTYFYCDRGFKIEILTGHIIETSYGYIGKCYISKSAYDNWKDKQDKWRELSLLTRNEAPEHMATHDIVQFINDIKNKRG